MVYYCYKEGFITQISASEHQAGLQIIPCFEHFYDKENITALGFVEILIKYINNKNSIIETM